jgi:hypothetical protein
MNKCILFSCVLFFNIFNISAQTGSSGRNSVREGIFYCNPINSGKSYTIIRTDSSQTEIDISSGDSSFWRISWLNDSSFSLKHLRSTRQMSVEEIQFYIRHIVICKVNDITFRYYTYSAAMDSLNSGWIVKDTIWFKPRALH